jgi:hypothetical protein
VEALDGGERGWEEEGSVARGPTWEREGRAEAQGEREGGRGGHGGVAWGLGGGVGHFGRRTEVWLWWTSGSGRGRRKKRWCARVPAVATKSDLFEAVRRFGLVQEEKRKKWLHLGRALPHPKCYSMLFSSEKSL